MVVLQQEHDRIDIKSVERVRRKAGLAQYDIAYLLGIRRATYAKWVERGSIPDAKLKRAYFTARFISYLYRVNVLPFPKSVNAWERRKIFAERIMMLKRH